MRDTIAEAWLKKFGHEFKYLEEVPLSAVVVSDAARRNIRPTGKDDDTVIAYAEALEQGADFPAVMGYPVKTGYELINGIHRVAAMELAEKKTLDIYVVPLDREKDARTIEVLQRTANTVNGLSYDKDERIQHAMRIVGLGYTVADAARMMNLKAQVVANRLALILAQDRARSLNCPILDQDTSMLVLNKIKSPEVFAAACALAKSARLNSEHVKDLAQELYRAPTDKIRMNILDEWRAKWSAAIKETGNGSFGGPVSAARRAVAYMDKLSRQVTTEKFINVMHNERRDILRRIDAAIKYLQNLRSKVAADGVSVTKRGVKHADEVRVAH